MKPKTLIALRNESFFNTCKEVARSFSGRVSTKDIVDIALARPGVDYFVDYDTARRHVGRILRSRSMWMYAKVREGIWHELAFRVTRLMTRYPHLSSDQALARILAEGKASRYFIGASSARRIYQRMLKAECECRRAGEKCSTDHEKP